MNPPDGLLTRVKILVAANNVVVREGSNALTLDAVAKEAKVSKGGLLYHFPTKEALITGMVEALIDEADQSMLGMQAEDALKPGSWTRAYINSCRLSGETDSISAALIPAAAGDPGLLDPLRRYYENWQEKMDEELEDTTKSTLIRLALDGLWLADLLCLASPQGERRQKFFDELISMVNVK
jgi:AcrR family transcriptional regulator